jgi:hypothetical protein
MTLREIDKRPRKGKGSNAPLVTYDYTKEQIVKLVLNHSKIDKWSERGYSSGKSKGRIPHEEVYCEVKQTGT